LEYYAKILQYSQIILEKHENFGRSSYRNRCSIAGANGKIWLSIPVAGGRNHRQLYAETWTDNTQRWKAIHWQSIMSAYKHAPYFEHYAYRFEKFFTATQSVRLFDFNLEIFELTLKLLNSNIGISFSETFEKNIHGVEDLRNTIVPRQTHFTLKKKYHQVFEERHGFIENLSILDLLMNEGPHAKQFLTL